MPSGSRGLLGGSLSFVFLGDGGVVVNRWFERAFLLPVKIFTHVTTVTLGISILFRPVWLSAETYIVHPVYVLQRRVMRD